MLQKLEGRTGVSWDRQVEELHSLCSSSCIVRMINSERIGCAGHVACVGGYKIVYRILLILEGRDWEWTELAHDKPG